MNASTSTDTAFGWTDSYLVGYPAMDDTHREFVDHLDALFKATDADMPQRLQEMIDHSEHHFSQENRWMEETEFPARECHINEHAAVLTSMREVLAYLNDQAGDPNEARRLAIELSRWFPSHTDYLDASLAQWVSKKKMGGVPIVVRRGVSHNEEAR
ncbi:hemerythrin domain-containing protein [Pusillimonas sp. CC-YST705]|uniref:Hemerythrin domain-containing protein n=1 Tax=Mesopusillimonas faecipullorum TaxID=2755040 RepID=A0ABS8C9E3_9BURK|nr:hemerythrin domain-containing protein [Mesopusillimonas faecipullorum]MCB5362656.1 hemerythrin domain-containing protein [Mesopusillimonas faecipullorum]